MTGVALFLEPILAAMFLMAACAARSAPLHAATDGALAAAVVTMWVLTFLAYTRRIRSEGRIEQADRDIASFTAPRAPPPDGA